MRYFKSFFYNFLIVFFANHILPGVEVIDPTKLPHLGADLSFAFVLGLLNCLIYPVLKALRRADGLRICLSAAFLSLTAYAVLKILPLGIQVFSMKGYGFCTLFVFIGSGVINFLEFKQDQHHDHRDDSPKIDGI